MHRDLKPNNILIHRSGRAFVTDFGIALDDNDQGAGSRVAGTPLYMSPEQLAGDSHVVDGRSDIYSLGVILFEAVTGVHPTIGVHAADKVLDAAFTSKPATPIRQRIKASPNFERICMKALEKEPAHRFSTAEDFARALRRCVPTQLEENRCGVTLPLERTTRCRPR